MMCTGEEKGISDSGRDVEGAAVIPVEVRDPLQAVSSFLWSRSINYIYSVYRQQCTHTQTVLFCFFLKKGLVFCANISPVLCVLQWISGIFLFSMLLSWQFKLDILATSITFMMCF